MYCTMRCIFFWADDAPGYSIPSFQCWGLKVANGWENQRDYPEIHSHPSQSCVHFLVYLVNKCLQNQDLNNIRLYVKTLHAHAGSCDFF